MKKKQTILVVASLLVVVLSVTLAYFTAQIIGKGKDVSVSSADLKIVFTDTDGNIEGNGITPGWSNTKTFTVKNDSNGTYKYDIIIKDLVNTFKTYKYLQYKITSTDGGYNMTDYSYLPKSSTKEDVALAYEISIDKGKTHTYTIEIKYVNDAVVDQSIDMGQSLSGTIYIREFTKPTMKLTDKLMADNPTIGTRTTFTAFTETNTGTLYKATEQIGTNPVKDVYYFAGDAKNNWVKFGKTKESSCTYKGKELFIFNDTGLKNVETQTECETYSLCNHKSLGPMLVENSSMCGNKTGTILTEKATWNGTSTKDIYWRIIRTNADGSIKLLYAGTSPDTDKAYIGASAFNTTYNDPMYVGYKYGTTGSLENNRLNTNNSTIKTVLDNWYVSNIKDTTNEQYVVDAIYCNDRELQSGTGIGTTTTYYKAYNRLNTNKTPTLKCNQVNDRFTKETTVSGVTGNGALTYPIGLITADEVAYAGGKNGSDNSKYYLYTGNWYWTMSPSHFYGSDADGFVVNSTGSLNYLSVDNGLNAVRPVISLSSGALSSGTGTKTDPFKIS